MTDRTIFFSVQAETPSEAESGLPARPRARAARLARTLLSNMLADIWDLPSHEVQVCSEQSGRPYLTAKRADRLPFISLSHSRGWVACAASEVGPVGIDIERHRPGRNHSGISSVAFGPLERARMLGAGVGAFYRIWTLREAVAKACGQGLVLATDGRDRVHDGPDQGEWVTPLDGSWWALSHRFMESDLSLSTAVMLSDPAQRVAHVRWDDSLNAGR